MHCLLFTNNEFNRKLITNLLCTQSIVTQSFDSHIRLSHLSYEGSPAGGSAESWDLCVSPQVKASRQRSSGSLKQFFFSYYCIQYIHYMKTILIQLCKKNNLNKVNSFFFKCSIQYTKLLKFSCLSQNFVRLLVFMLNQKKK